MADFNDLLHKAKVLDAQALRKLQAQYNSVDERKLQLLLTVQDIDIVDANTYLRRQLYLNLYAIPLCRCLREDSTTKNEDARNLSYSLKYQNVHELPPICCIDLSGVLGQYFRVQNIQVAVALLTSHIVLLTTNNQSQHAEVLLIRIGS